MSPTGMGARVKQQGHPGGQAPANGPCAPDAHSTQGRPGQANSQHNPQHQVCQRGDHELHHPACAAQHSATHQLYSRLFSEQHLNWSPEIEVATTAQVLSVVKQDLGIGFVPDFMAQEALAHGEVIQLTLAEDLPEREILLVDDSSRPQSTAVQARIRLLEQSGAPSPRHE